MKVKEASRTAEFNALFRALESSRRPRRKRLFEDPLAPAFLGRKGRKFLHLSRIPLIGRIVPLYIDRKWPGVRASAVGRTCWIDDQLRAALHGGISQVVILGAGYDCRAYRLSGIERTHVFELDQPSTLAEKKARLTFIYGALPVHVTFVEVDFNQQEVSTVLKSSGFDQFTPTFFLIEGVFHYLTAQAVDATLRSISSVASPGSQLIFTYIHQGLLDGSVLFGNMGHVPTTLQESNETWTFGFRPEKLLSYLTERGFFLVTDVGSTEYRAQYMGPSGRHMKGFEFYRVALAEVKRLNMSS